MHFSRTFKFWMITVLTIMLSHLPHVAMAEVVLTQNEMVSTTSIVQEFSREQTENKILSYLNKDEVQKKLIESGVQPDEAKARLAALSNQELQQLSVQIDKAQYGGDILVAILLVVLIIFLIKRI